MVRIGLVGAGLWGTNLLRVLVASRRAELVVVADPEPRALERAAVLAPRASRVRSLGDALALHPDAVVIATPPTTHAALLLQALDGGVDVLVEKPLAISPEDAEACVARASALGRIAMVGHLLLFHPAVERILALAQAGYLGELVRFDTQRLSFRGDPTTSALWTLGPHDLAVLHALDPRPLASITARAEAGGDGAVDVVARLEGGLLASIRVSRQNATKERRMRVTGTERVVLLDDARAPDRLFSGRSDGRRGGTSWEQELPVPWEEPLAREIEHFLGCVERRSRPRASLVDGAWVVRALAQAEAALGFHAGSAAIADTSPRHFMPGAK